VVCGDGPIITGALATATTGADTPEPVPRWLGNTSGVRHADDGHPVLPGFDHLVTGPITAPVVWGAPPAGTVARFWSKVTRTAGCWWWTGAVSHPDGYGRITWTQDGAARTLSAHRFALLLDLGQFEEGMVSEHHCNETLCVRVHPEHLHPGTQSANLRYAVALGRHRGPHAGDIDPRGRHNRALAIRAALAGGYDPVLLAAARDPNPAPGLFGLADLAPCAPRGDR